MSILQKSFVLFFVLLIFPNLLCAQTISKKEAFEDLSQFQSYLESYAAYLKLYPVDQKQHLDSLRYFLQDENDVLDFAQDLRNLLGLTGDAHATIKLPKEIPSEAYSPKGYLPFILRHQECRAVAIDSNMEHLWVENYPFLKKINDVPLEELMSVCATGQLRSSKARYYRKSIKKLHSVRFALQQTAAEHGDSLWIELTNYEKDTMLFTIMNKENPYHYRYPHNNETGMLDDNIAYLRIPKMYDKTSEREMADYAAVLGSMLREDFRNSDGLIIDLRNNPGGKHHLLMELLPYFIDEPMVVNVGITRTSRIEGLNKRGLYEAKDFNYTAAEKEMLKEFKSTFKTAWNYPQQDFLPELYYMVISPDIAEYRYLKPIVVLMDERNFNTSEIFLSGLKQLEQTTIIGQPSSGGSGRSNSFVLTNSKIQVNFSTMASFNADGTLIEGIGITPDLQVVPTIDDLLGKTDRLLNKAQRMLIKKQANN